MSMASTSVSDESSGKQLQVTFMLPRLNRMSNWQSINSVFIESGKLESALVAYERALLWREALDLATRLDIGDESLSELSYRIGGKYVSVSLVFPFQ